MRRLFFKQDNLEVATKYIKAAAQLCGDDVGELKPHEFRRLTMHLIKSLSLLSEYERRSGNVKCDYNFILDLYNEHYPEWIKRSQKKIIIAQRYTLVYFLREYTTLTFEEIGEILGEKCKRKKFDHSTMVHAYDSVVDMLETSDPSYTQITHKMESIIQDILGITEQKQIEAA